jgi:hypothetical protein
VPEILFSANIKRITAEGEKQARIKPSVLSIFIGHFFTPIS